jgi:hypothetical protein
VPDSALEFADVFEAGGTEEAMIFLKDKKPAVAKSIADHKSYNLRTKKRRRR